MNNDNPYTAPESDVSLSAEPGSPTSRKELIPLWIKIFGWLFIVFGALVTLIAAYSAVTRTAAEFALYGLTVSGSIYNPVALFVAFLIMAHGVCAFGLLFGKSWGVISCMVLGYISIAVCIVSMFIGEGFTIRLEIAFLIPYLIKLHKIRDQWSQDSSRRFI